MYTHKIIHKNKINATRKFKLSILGYTVVNLLCEGRDIPHDFEYIDPKVKSWHKVVNMQVHKLISCVIIAQKFSMHRNLACTHLQGVT